MLFCLQGSFFDNATDLSGESEASLNCNLDIFVGTNGLVGKYVIWPPREQLDNVQLRNKGALVENDQTALSHSLYQQHAHSGPRRLDFHRSAGFVADSFIALV